jgi:23S rRNA (guanosine2251-2'-O)-methyltransferase
MSSAKRRNLLGSHQKCWLWGRNVVLETLRAGTWPVLELHLAGTLSAGALEEAKRLGERLGAPVKVQAAARLEQLCHAPQHQGYLAKMGPFPYADAEALLATPPADALYLALDRLQDPQNFGAIVRSAEVFGASAVLIGEREQAGVTTAVARASAGAVSRVPIGRTADLAALADRAKEAGLALVGASEKAQTDAADCDLARPLALLIGSETHGLRRELVERCDVLVRIPQHGTIGSLNAAAAAAVLLYEVRRQRTQRQPR